MPAQPVPAQPAGVRHPDAEGLLHGLDESQRAAVMATSGPVVILAGAGTGKTRVISHRAAYAAATGAAPADRMLLVTFTDRAATEMMERMRGLGAGRVTARTVHSAALAQLRHFWPRHHGGADLPQVVDDRYRLVAPLVGRLPGGYRFTPVKDLLEELSWAKRRRIGSRQYPHAAETRDVPIPTELFARLFADYERAKARLGAIDFEDMLTLTIDLLEGDEGATQAVRQRYAWFSVDEYQDTDPLQQRLLELWLGDRRDVCVVGDEDQTIFTFAGASPRFLTGFRERYPDATVIDLLDNYRSSPQVLELANRLLASTGRAKRLRATRPAGPEPDVRRFRDAQAEANALVAAIRALLERGVAEREVAVLVRLNAQVAPLEAAFTRAGIPYRVRGQRFFERREVRTGVELLGRVGGDPSLTGPQLVEAMLARWKAVLGFEPDAEPSGAEGRERQAALEALLGIVQDAVAAEPTAGAGAVLEELQRRRAAEAGAGDDAVELSTLHRAKGLEWDAVFLPMLEEGILPVAQAVDPEALDEERRLLYVGITRARRHLWLSWARYRTGARGGATRQRSRFLDQIAPERQLPLGRGSRATVRAVDEAAGRVRVAAQGTPPTGDPLFEALRAWRSERARADGVPAYVIAHDATLAEIAARRPGSLGALRAVAGIGPAKVERYGEEIVAVVARHPGTPRVG
jgi:DNA helicase-2/ATP-dependent DNA helicase PcrA